MAQLPPPGNADNLYVADLPPGIDENGLRKAFAQYGTVTQCKVLQGGGSALVRFASAKEAKWVVDNLNNNIPQGMTTPVVVRYANTPGGAGKGGMMGPPMGAFDKGGFAKGGGGGGGGFMGPGKGMPMGGGGFDKGAGGKSFVGKGGPGPAFGGSLGFGAGMPGKGSPGGFGGGPGGPGGPGGFGAPGGGKGFGGGKAMDGGKGFGKMDGGPWGGFPGANAAYYPKDIKGLVRQLTSTNTLPGGGRWENNENTIFVGGLPEDTSDLDLYQMFSPFGAIAPRGATAMKDKETGNCTGIGFVNYLDASHAQLAIRTLNGTMMSDGSTLAVKVKGPPKKDKEKAAKPP
eukprot:gnl/TRDRNA2_/TRDRNA2_42001_c0_seq1.p1 gnl/TRDRNA2_/TRDRNA2_42001_c0~~gnl/TRDRNA2_/TRDRNA2_42001_c0_seq1.p1  ORF type:complete len:345 (-),score=83.50 gnl/TRDRNA2_/TRDRNA2_42001_c0_seq1:112-1146(-)